MEDCCNQNRNAGMLARLLAQPRGHVHCLGVCGVGMAGLAFQLRRDGWQVSGCDAGRGARMSDWLEEQGVHVFAGHSAAHLDGVDWVIRSTAVPAALPELRAAQAAGLPVFQRGTVLAAWLRNWTSAAVCGTHGKTTTSAMLTQILRQCGLAPAWCIGGDCPALDGGAGRGNGARICVVEADESDGTLAEYAPDVTVLTNVEFDHAEHYNGMEDLRRCFAAVLANTRGRVIYCADDPEAAALGGAVSGAIGYGFSDGAAVRGSHLRDDGQSIRMQLRALDAPPVDLALPVAGRHNALNALAACAAAQALGCAPDNAARALAGFVPVRRRFETVAAGRGIRVFSDYAHHPTEIKAAVNMFSLLPRPPDAPGESRRRRLAVFQPHRYTRTRALAEAFPGAFAGVDELLLAPVYAASETAEEGGTVWDLYAAFRKSPAGPPRVMAAELPEIWDYLRRILAPGDDLLVAGAGDVERLAGWAAEALPPGRPLSELNPLSRWRAELAEMELSAATRWQVWQPLSAGTTWRVGGPADILMDAGSLPDAAAALRWAARRGIPVTFLGAGSNVLVSDLGVRGMVLRLAGDDFRRISRLGPDRLQAGAGVRLAELTSWCAAQGLGGLEFLHGIPGTLGGALRMNAGAWGGEIGTHVLSAQCLDRNGAANDLPAAGLGFEYRTCRGLEARLAVGAVLQVEPAEPAAIRRRLSAIGARRRKMQWGASAGSVFRNPPGDYAGRLLEAAGCKRLAVGGARVSAIHANVITAEAGGTAGDIRALIEIMKKRVYSGFNIELVPEIVYCD